jgi:hypothetical protein
MNKDFKISFKIILKEMNLTLKLDLKEESKIFHKTIIVLTQFSIHKLQMNNIIYQVKSKKMKLLQIEPLISLKLIMKKI